MRTLAFTCDDGTDLVLESFYYELERRPEPDAIIPADIGEPNLPLTFSGFVAHVTWDGREQLVLLKPSLTGERWVTEGFTFWAKDGAAILDVVGRARQSYQTEE